MNIRILVLSFYFKPDLSAGSFRTTAFVEQLATVLPEHAEIDVLTTRPNRYHSYQAEAPGEESIGKIKVRRYKLPLHKSGMVDQSKAFVSFAWQVLRQIRGCKYDLVYATSSRLFTAFLGALCANYLKAPLYLDIRDIFVDTIKDITYRPLLMVLLPPLKFVEKYTIRSASHVNLVSRGFLKYFESRYPGKKFSIFSNGIDDEFLKIDFSFRQLLNKRNRKIVYAGNIGASQGLDHIIPEFAENLQPDWRLQIIGDGGTKVKLQEAVRNKKLVNVDFIDPIPREQLIEYYRDADVLFLHLNDREAFHKVLPSKLFEYAATGKPILAGVAGYAEQFIAEEITNAQSFKPCDASMAMMALQRLKLEYKPRDKFISQYKRRNIIDQLAENVLQVVK